ncbi:glycerol dehydratase reactivase beta/small subunit family protein [Kluyvera sichuanensis]|uniref:glycerol dehydratase reactivase beta/small subunit family protein n=1 Tax=Kluyvera sichuanensis TaxID=2725494 RepID=UPI0039F5788E
MQNPGVPTSPAVHLFYHPSQERSEALRQISLGLEEQGVPCRPLPCDEQDDAMALARNAAQHSALRIGIGMTASGDVALTHAQYPAGRALRHLPAASTQSQWRNLGANAGQLVKTLPLTEVE